MSLLEIEKLEMRFGGLIALKELDCSVEEGEIFTIIGPNGAGKSTLFNIISRFYDPFGGAIFYRGENLLRRPSHAIPRLGIARTFQNIELFEGATVLENMLLGRHIRRQTGFLSELLFLPSARREEEAHRHKAEEIMDFLKLEAYRDQRIANLPYGVRKIVELGRALASEPKLLLLDEPSSGLNAEETRDMAFWIHDIRDLLGATILLVEHDMTLVRAVSDRVLALNQGRALALGSPAEVSADKAVARAYLGEDA